MELSVRLGRRRAASVKLHDASRIVALVDPELRHLQQEHFRMVLLDAKLQPIAVGTILTCLLGQALVQFSPQPSSAGTKGQSRSTTLRGLHPAER